jgi:hypothetical protein
VLLEPFFITPILAHEKFNVYTNPLEIQSIVIVHRQYSELGAWNLSLFLSNEFNVHVCAMSIMRVLYPEKYKCKKIIEKIKFFEKPRSHIMYHADTMEVVFNNGSVVYQISIEDDYSRGYMALCVFYETSLFRGIEHASIF